jgi:hypothetical protein
MGPRSGLDSVVKTLPGIEPQPGSYEGKSIRKLQMDIELKQIRVLI